MDLIRKSYPFTRMALLFALVFVCFFVFCILMVLLFPAISGGYTLEQITCTAVWGSPSFAFAAKMLQFLYTTMIFLAPGLLLSWIASPKPEAYLGLERRAGCGHLGMAMLVKLCAFPMVGLLSECNESWPLPKSLMDIEESAKVQTEMMLKMPDLTSMLTNLLLVALAPAIAEEVLFRGVMQKLITQMIKNGWVAAL